MSQVYIQCNGFRQLAKISSFLLAYPTDVKYSDVSIKTTMSSTKVKFEIYLLSFPHVDHVGFWEFLMDYAPIPDRFVSCDEEEEVDLSHLWVATGKTIKVDPSIPIYNAHTGLYS